MANSFDSDNGGAAEVVLTTLEGNLQPSEGSGSSASPVTPDSFENHDGNGLAETTLDAVVQQEMVVPVIEEQTSTEGASATCSKECANELVETEILNFSTDGDVTKSKMKGQELKEKKPRRRGGKVRKINEGLNYCPSERKEKKGLQYSREEMEGLRFEKLEEQKIKWLQVYCGLGMVAVEYDGLAKVDKIHQEDSVPTFDFDFDPRPQFLKSTNSGEQCTGFSDKHLDNLNKSDSSTFLFHTDENGLSVEGEEFYEDEDSDEDYSSIQRPALYVTGEPDFDSGPPLDGLEYLRRVRWETARIPKVKVAKVNKTKEQSDYMPKIPEVMKCPENLLPLKEWEDSFLSDFTELRQAFTQLDLQGSGGESTINVQSVQVEHILSRMIETDSFEIFSLASMDNSSPSEASNEFETGDSKPIPDSPDTSRSSTDDRPTLSKILKMDSAARTSMLKKRISSIENMSRLSHDESLWLFALCVAVDCPFNADTSAAVRSLLRKCASLRAAKAEVDDEVIILNILVTIAGRYFGQLEK